MKMLKQDFEEALRRVEGAPGVEFPEEHVERRLTANLANLRWRLNIATIIAVSGWILAVVAFARTWSL